MTWLRRLFCRHDFQIQHESNREKVLWCSRCDTERWLRFDCNHDWIEKYRTVAQPCAPSVATDLGAALNDLAMLSEERIYQWLAVERATRMGSTTVTLWCSKCSALHVVTSEGTGARNDMLSAIEQS